MFEIGTSLREARLRQGLDFPEIEQGTKIRGKYLKALEGEQFDQLPAQTYVKGFLRAYAEYLGLDGELYVDEFNSRYVVGEDEPVLRPRRSSAGRYQRRVESRVVYLALVAIGVLTALVIAAWKFGAPEEREVLPLDRPGATTVTPPADPTARRPAPLPTRRVAASLVLTASDGDCWLRVHKDSARGKQVFEGTLERGKSMRFWSRRLWIAAGAPDNLRVTLNGERLRFPPGSPSVVIVTADGLKRAPTS